MDQADRVRFVVALVEALGKDAWVGKTHVQKTAYFAQEAAGIDLGLQFVIHHYGPYSFELDSLMQTLDSEGVLNVTPEADGYGYEVSVGDEAHEIDVADETSSSAESVAGIFAGLPVAELELLSTSYYVMERLPGAAKDVWNREVKRLKPRFSEDEVSRALDEAASIARALNALR